MSMVAWFDEWRYYTFGDGVFPGECEPGFMCGHLTAMIWADTTKIGCAVSTCDDFFGGNRTWVYSVCRYWPAGNIVGRKIYEVEDSILYRFVDSSWLVKMLVILILLSGIAGAYILMHSEVLEKVKSEGCLTNKKEDSKNVVDGNNDGSVVTEIENESLENTVDDSYFTRFSTAILSIFNQSEKTSADNQ